jgi:hypothetical protein
VQSVLSVHFWATGQKEDIPYKENNILCTCRKNQKTYITKTIEHLPMVSNKIRRLLFSPTKRDRECYKSQFYLKHDIWPPTVRKYIDHIYTEKNDLYFEKHDHYNIYTYL